MMLFQEPVRMRVLHPTLGMFEVPAYCPIDARLQAANHWDVPYEEVRQCKVAVETAALQRVGKEKYSEDS